MITLTSAQLSSWVALLVWPFARILALIAAAPITGNPQFPVRAKIGLAVMITVLVAPFLPAGTTVEVADAREIEKAFHDAFITLDRRIGLFLSLPLSSIDSFALKKEIDRIGQQ